VLPAPGASPVEAEITDGAVVQRIGKRNRPVIVETAAPLGRSQPGAVGRPPRK
jgi:hypothetical protein